MKVITQPQQMQGIATAATIGMFDGLHLGHQCLLSSLKREAEARHLATAVVTFREHPQNVLHGRGLKWICTTDERVQSLAEQGIDYLILMDFTPELARLDSSEYMRMLRDSYGMQALVVGFNHHFGHNRGDGFTCYCRQGSQLGIEVLCAEEYAGSLAPVSSSILRQMISDGNVEGANHRLWHPYSISGTVVHGQKNGRKIGFPTANVGDCSAQKMMPQCGVYAALASVDGGQWMPAMANIGTRPTVSDSGVLSVEVNIFDFDADIYGHPFEVRLLKHLRPEQRFGSLSQLQQQLSLDRVAARQYISKITSQLI